MTAERLPNGPCEHVRLIRDSLPAGYQWDEREAALLDLAASLARNVERLEADVAVNGVRLEGGKLNAALCELRQQQVALARVLGQIAIPDSVKPAVVHARKAAEARWNGAA